MCERFVQDLRIAAEADDLERENVHVDLRAVLSAVLDQLPRVPVRKRAWAAVYGSIVAPSAQSPAYPHWSLGGIGKSSKRCLAVLVVILIDTSQNSARYAVLRFNCNSHSFR